MADWGKHVAIEFRSSIADPALRTLAGAITYAYDYGPRITFEAQRSMRSDPDIGVLKIYNLPDSVIAAISAHIDDFKQSLKVVQSSPLFRDGETLRAQKLHEVIENHIVEVYAGREGSPQLVFRGDPIKVRPKVRDGADIVTEIELGDAFVALEQQYLASTYGVGETPANMLAFAMALADAKGDVAEMRSKIGLVAANAYSVRLANGFAFTGRPADTIDDIADVLGLQWWVRDGKVELIPRAQVLPDFAVLISENLNAMAIGEPDDQQDVEFECLLHPSIHPGRGVKFEWLDGRTATARVHDTMIRLDTHSDAWSISGKAAIFDAVLPVVVQ